MARPNRTYIDLTGRVVGRSRVLGRAGNTPPPYSRPLWRVLCDPDLGGCGTVRDVPGQIIRDRKLDLCRSCRGREHAARQMTSGHTARLHEPVWVRVCGTCGAEFTGTARQQYCRVECRPSHRSKL